MKECPDSNNLTAFQTGEISADEREKIETHLAECPKCQEFLADSSTEQNHAAAKSFFSLSGMPKNLKIALAVTLVIWFGLVGVYLLRNKNVEAPADILKKNRTYTQQSTFELLAPENDIIIEGTQIDFEWAKVADANSYNVFITNQKGDIIFQGQTAQPRFSYQTASPSKKTGTNEIHYFWYVQANAANGKVTESNRRKFIFKN